MHGEASEREEFAMSKTYSQYRFFNLPRKVQIDDYSRVKGKVIEELCESCDIKSVYSMGGLNHPGISDLDIIFVLERLNHTKAKDYLELRDGDEISNYILTHNLGYPINKFTLNNLKLLHYTPAINYEIGEKMDLWNISEQEQTLANISFIIGIVPIRMFQFHGCLANKFINVRHALLALYSLRYSIAIMKDLSGSENPSWNKFASDITWLRDNWFSLELDVRKELLISTFREGTIVCKGIIDKLADWMKKVGFDIHPFRKPCKCYLKLKKQHLIFMFSDELWNKTDDFPFLALQPLTSPYLNNMPARVKAFAKSNQWQVLILPQSLCSFYIIHSEFENEFSRVLRANLSSNIEEKVSKSEIPYFDAFKRQAEVYGQYMKFLVVNKFSYGLFSIVDLFLENESISYHPIKLIGNIVGRVLSEISYQQVNKEIERL